MGMGCTPIFVRIEKRHLSEAGEMPYFTTIEIQDEIFLHQNLII